MAFSHELNQMRGLMAIGLQSCELGVLSTYCFDALGSPHSHIVDIYSLTTHYRRPSSTYRHRQPWVD